MSWTIEAEEDGHVQHRLFLNERTDLRPCPASARPCRAGAPSVVALVEAITPRYRAAVLLAAWCGLRRGEVLGLRRGDVDLVVGTVTVRRNRVELMESGRAAFDAEPKTDAGK